MRLPHAAPQILRCRTSLSHSHTQYLRMCMCSLHAVTAWQGTKTAEKLSLYAVYFLPLCHIAESTFYLSVTTPSSYTSCQSVFLKVIYFDVAPLFPQIDTQSKTTPSIHLIEVIRGRVLEKHDISKQGQSSTPLERLQLYGGDCTLYLCHDETQA